MIRLPRLETMLWLAVAAGLAIALWGLYAWGRSAGRADVQARWDRTKIEALEKQDARIDRATEVLIQEVEVIRTVYRDRIKEVEVYVPPPDTLCPADPEFVRLFNAEP